MTTPGLHTFPAQLLVFPGDRIGLHSTGGTCGSAAPGATFSTRTGALTSVGATAEYTSGTGAAFDVSAVVEPDRDQDGYGDETQDQCPVYGGAPCPTPDTVITQKPKKKAPVSRLAFTATTAASGFVCQLDEGKAKGCTSPVKYRCLAPGKHRFLVFALGTRGDPDTTPASARFTLSERRPGCAR